MLARPLVYRLSIILCLLAALAQPSPALSQAGDLFPSAPAASGVMFVENVGQFGPEVLYSARWAEGTIWLTDTSLWLALAGEERPKGAPQPDAALRLDFQNAQPPTEVTPFGPVATSVNYYPSADPSTWREGVPVWSGVRYHDVYPGLDLVVHGQDGGWGWRLEAGNGSTGYPAGSVGLVLQGAVAATGDAQAVRVSTTAGTVSLPGLQYADAAPDQGYSLQAAGHSTFVPFAVANETPSLAAQAPGLVYLTYLGGTGSDRAFAVEADGSGAALIAGYTQSVDFPTAPGAFDSSHNGQSDAFVARLNPAGSALEYVTFIGGTLFDYGRGLGSLALDPQGNAYLTGWTDSTDFPTTAGAPFRTLAGSYDVFALKLGTDGGSLVYSTLLGGTSADYGRAIAVAGDGSAVITGQTLSEDFPTSAGVCQPAFAGGAEGDAFVARLSPNGQTLEYSTYLGGSADDWATDLALDATGNVVLTGQTWSADFPVSESAYSTTLTGTVAAFVTSLAADGTEANYSTLLGGSGSTFGRALELTAGGVYITGYTDSADFPTTPTASAPTYLGGEWDAFIAQIGQMGQALQYSSFVGGSGADYGRALASDGGGSLYLAGETDSPDLPIFGSAALPPAGGTDAFLVQISGVDRSLLYATYLGGTGADAAYGVSASSPTTILVAGETSSTDLPVTAGVLDPAHNGGADAFVARIEPGEAPPRAFYLPVLWRSG